MGEKKKSALQRAVETCTLGDIASVMEMYPRTELRISRIDGEWELRAYGCVLALSSIDECVVSLGAMTIANLTGRR